MVTIQTIVVYSLLIFLMFLLCSQGNNKVNNQTNNITSIIYSFIAICVYAIVFGLRYGVGVDYMGYLDDYTTNLLMGFVSHRDDTEPGFLAIRTFFAHNGFHYSWYFGFIAFLQLALIFLALKSNKEVYPFLVLSFGLMCIWLSYANGLRQQLAFCFFAFALSLCNHKKNIVWVLTLIFCALTMHKSAVIVIPLLLILSIKKEWFSNTKIQLILLLVAVLLGRTPIVESIISQSDNYIQYLEIFNYEGYLDEDFAEDMISRTTSRGVGFYILLLIDICLIALSSKVKNLCNSSFLVRAYNLYYIGVLMHYALIASSLLQRINYYFYGFNFIIMAFTLYYLWRKNKKLYLGLLGVLIVCFIGYLYRMYDNTAAYYFFWQQDLYHLNH